MGVGGCDERGISIFVLNFEQTPRTMLFQGEWDWNTPSFDLDVFEQNYVNYVNMLLWIPIVELKVKD